MGKLNVKNGTPVGNAHLCRGCTHGQFVAGYRESDQLVICMRNFPSIPVPFVVFDCTEFHDKFKPTIAQMKKLAIHLKPVRVSARTSGFSTPTTVVPISAPAAIEDDEDDEEEVART